MTNAWHEGTVDPMTRSENALAAAEFFDRITAEVSSSTSARRQLRREYMWPAEAPARVKQVREYDAETDRLLSELREVVAA